VIVDVGAEVTAIVAILVSVPGGPCVRVEGHMSIRWRWNWNGSVAVVTGASSGIGKAVAVELARRGAIVAGVARRQAELAAALDECRRHVPDSIYQAADLSSRAGCEAATTAILRRLGRIDILVNNAGISIRKPAVLTTVEDVERVMAINFFAAVYLTMAMLPAMLERRRGSVVNITSVAGYLPNPKESAYGASKAALSLWSHGLNVDLHGTGVHVGVVSPGPIATEIWEQDEFAASYTGKLYPPAVVAETVVKVIERRLAHVTVPRRFGMPPILYPMLGRPMRWGLRRYDQRAGRHPVPGSR
jgi:short-subunit dehydrogenase